MYNTHLNIIAGIPDLSLINEVLKYSKGEKKITVPDGTINDLCNRYGIRTQKAMARFIRAINKTYNVYENSNHQQLFQKLIGNDNFSSVKSSVLFFQMAINNSLFYDMTINVYCKQYFAGKLHTQIDNYYTYIDSLRENHVDINNWSDSTIKIISSKYLTLLKKFGLLEGKAKKTFKSVMLDDLTLVCLIYLIKSLDDGTLNIFESRYFPLFLMSREIFLKQVKNIAKVDYFEITTLGYDLRIDLKYSFQEIIDVLTKNHRSEV